MDKRLIKFIGDKLLEDVDVETENVGLGKTVWDDLEFEDDGEDITYVEFYNEIPLAELNELAFAMDTSLDILIDSIKMLVKENTVLLLRYAFVNDENLQQYVFDLDHIETFEELDKREELFIIDINLMATPRGGEHGPV